MTLNDAIYECIRSVNFPTSNCVRCDIIYVIVLILRHWEIFPSGLAWHWIQPLEIQGIWKIHVSVQ